MIMNFRMVKRQSQDVVEIPNSSIDSGRMALNNYTPGQNAKLGSNGKIDINDNFQKQEGFLQFIPYDARDGGGFRILLAILMTANIGAFIALSYILIKSLI